MKIDCINSCPNFSGIKFANLEAMEPFTRNKATCAEFRCIASKQLNNPVNIYVKQIGKKIQFTVGDHTFKTGFLNSPIEVLRKAVIQANCSLPKDFSFREFR